MKDSLIPLKLKTKLTSLEIAELNRRTSHVGNLVSQFEDIHLKPETGDAAEDDQWSNFETLYYKLMSRADVLLQGSQQTPFDVLLNQLDNLNAFSSAKGIQINLAYVYQRSRYRVLMERLKTV